jgi:transposase-like protein
MIQEANTRTRKRRPRYSEEQRAAIVAEYEAWEGGLMEFRRARGVSAGSVCAWRRRLREQVGSDRGNGIRPAVDLTQRHCCDVVRHRE